jgi:hypothetical protein
LLEPLDARRFRLQLLQACDPRPRLIRPALLEQALDVMGQVLRVLWVQRQQIKYPLVRRLFPTPAVFSALAVRSQAFQPDRCSRVRLESLTYGQCDFGLV